MIIDSLFKILFITIIITIAIANFAFYISYDTYKADFEKRINNKFVKNITEVQEYNPYISNEFIFRVIVGDKYEDMYFDEMYQLLLVDSISFYKWEKRDYPLSWDVLFNCQKHFRKVDPVFIYNN